MKTTIRLNRRDNKIQVKRVKSNIRLGVTRHSVNLRHSGLRGPQGIQGIQGDKGDKGDTGDTGISTFVRAHHRDNASLARPNAVYVEWVGSVAPLHATEEDTWIATP